MYNYNIFIYLFSWQESVQIKIETAYMSQCQKYLDGFGGDCGSCLQHAVSYTQLVCVSKKRCNKSDVFGSSPWFKQAQGPLLSVAPYVIKDQVKPKSTRNKNRDNDWEVIIKRGTERVQIVKTKGRSKVTYFSSALSGRSTGPAV